MRRYIYTIIKALERPEVRSKDTLRFTIKKDHTSLWAIVHRTKCTLDRIRERTVHKLFICSKSAHYIKVLLFFLNIRTICEQCLRLVVGMFTSAYSMPEVLLVLVNMSTTAPGRRREYFCESKRDTSWGLTTSPRKTV